jgi:hypothetical protein
MRGKERKPYGGTDERCAVSESDLHRFSKLEQAQASVQFQLAACLPI